MTSARDRVLGAISGRKRVYICVRVCLLLLLLLWC